MFLGNGLYVIENFLLSEFGLNRCQIRLYIGWYVFLLFVVLRMIVNSFVSDRHPTLPRIVRSTEKLEERTAINHVLNELVELERLLTCFCSLLDSVY